MAKPAGTALLRCANCRRLVHWYRAILVDRRPCCASAGCMVALEWGGTLRAVGRML